MLLVSTPFITSLIALLSGYFPSSGRSKKILAFILSLIPLAYLFYGYGSWQGLEIEYPWISTLGINFHLKIDALSIVFIALTALITPVAIAAVQSDKDRNLPLYFCLILLLQGFLFLLFTARDLALFTLAWEALLLPIFFIMNLWGGPRRQTAALQFLIYMIAGSVLLVAAVLALYFTAGSTFNMDKLAASASLAPYALAIFAVFILAFAVKTPLFPFHAWLPDAYVEAPFAGTILLSALLSKAGIYGFARIGFDLFPKFMEAYSLPLVVTAIIGTLYAAITACTQKGIKNVIAYSSLSHVNFILAGLCLATPLGYQGAILQAFNHGVTIAALFLVTLWLYVRNGQTTLEQNKGMAKYFPTLCWVTLFFVLASVALPATNNFVGELIILLALFKKHPYLAAVLTLSIILSAIYMLRWMQKIYFEEPKTSAFPIGTTQDIGGKEMILALPLIAAILAVGIYPTPLLQTLEPESAKLNPEHMVAYDDSSFYERENDRRLEEALQRKVDEQKALDNRQYNDRIQQNIQQNAQQNQRDTDNRLQRAQEERRLEDNRLENNRLEDNRLERQRLERRAEDRRAEDRRLERSRENR